jgi:hypothetical protein
LGAGHCQCIVTFCEGITKHPEKCRFVYRQLELQQLHTGVRNCELDADRTKNLRSFEKKKPLMESWKTLVEEQDIAAEVSV